MIVPSIYYDRHVDPTLAATLLPGGALRWLVCYLNSLEGQSRHAHLHFRRDRSSGRRRGSIKLYWGRTSPLEFQLRTGNRVRLAAAKTYSSQSSALFSRIIPISELAGLEAELRTHLSRAAVPLRDNGRRGAFLNGEATCHAGLMRRYGQEWQEGDPFVMIDAEIRVGYADSSERKAVRERIRQELGLVSRHACYVAFGLITFSSSHDGEEVGMKRYVVALEKEERDELAGITRKGSHQSQKVINALILLNCDEGEFNEHRARGEAVAEILRISARKVDRVKKRFVHGLEAELRTHLSRAAVPLRDNGRRGAFLNGEATCHAGLMRRYGQEWQEGDPFVMIDAEIRVGYADSSERKAVRERIRQELGLGESVPTKLDALGVLPTGDIALIEVKPNNSEKYIQEAAMQAATHVAIFSRLRLEGTLRDSIQALQDQKRAVGLIPGEAPTVRERPEIVPWIAAADDTGLDWEARGRERLARVDARVRSRLSDVRLARLSREGLVLEVSH